MVFLDFKKANDTLDIDRTITILRGYGVHINITSFLKKISDMDTMVPKQGGFLGIQFNARHGVRQGDTISPIIFNIVADAVSREGEEQFIQNQSERKNLINMFFYADDSAILGEDPNVVQLLLDLFTTTFVWVGLNMNANKTEYMIMDAGKVTQPKS
jgi:Reverse transcriptase (RNA-dependent DNA polymerase)